MQLFPAKKPPGLEGVRGKVWAIVWFIMLSHSFLIEKKSPTDFSFWPEKICRILLCVVFTSSRKNTPFPQENRTKTPAREKQTLSWKWAKLILFQAKLCHCLFPRASCWLISARESFPSFLLLLQFLFLLVKVQALPVDCSAVRGKNLLFSHKAGQRSHLLLTASLWRTCSLGTRTVDLPLGSWVWGSFHKLFFSAINQSDLANTLAWVHQCWLAKPQMAESPLLLYSTD